MGYVHDTETAVRLPPELALFETGSWTQSVASNIHYVRKAAASETATVHIPIATILQNSAALKGSLIKSIDIWYEITVASPTSITPTIYKATMPADNTSYGTPSQPAFSYDSGHATAAQRYAVQKHKMTLTLTTPFYLADTDDLYVELVDVSGAGGAIFDYHGARVNVTTRL